MRPQRTTVSIVPFPVPQTALLREKRSSGSVLTPHEGNQYPRGPPFSTEELQVERGNTYFRCKYLIKEEGSWVTSFVMCAC